jgi:ferric-dicitrate binding protein FerR (iron transport regulator)
MKGSNLTKLLLLKLIFGDYNKKDISDSLNSDEVSSMLYLEWNKLQYPDIDQKPDYKILFEKIKDNINIKSEQKPFATKYLTLELERLNQKHLRLKKQFRIWISIAASLILLFCISTILFISKIPLLQKTVTESIAPYGQKSQLVLADGSKVYLNSGTVLRYDNRFGKQNRKIELTGEAYFEVKENKRIPFIITASDIEIKVLGTKFNVMAYPDESKIETTVTEGTVNVRELKNGNSVIITANQKASYSKMNHLLTQHNVNSFVYSSWKENILYFDNENFENVIKKLERWYNVNIELTGKDSVDDRFTLTIKNESLREVLDLIGLTTPLNYKIKDSHVIITYKNNKPKK